MFGGVPGGTSGPRWPRARTTIASYFGPGWLTTVNDATGSALYREGWPTALFHTSRRVTWMWTIYPSLFLQLEGGGVQVLLLTRMATGARAVQTIPEIGGVDTFEDFNSNLAGAGIVHFASMTTAFPAFDTAKDGVDRDCDGAD